MPFQTGLTPFTGDDDLADFMLDVYRDFAVTTMGWVDSAPVQGVHPEYEFWLHRGSLAVPEPPFGLYRTDGDGHMHIFTGDDVDDAQEIYDQPNNPMNCPQAADFSLAASVATARCLLMNDVVGPFQAYWLFGPADGSYIHCVVKVNSRQYRHFHVGLLSPLVDGLDAGSFYVTTHWWDQLSPSGKSTAASGLGLVVDGEHDPYTVDHLLPFANRGVGNELDNSFSRRIQLRGNWLYIPGINAGIDWYVTAGVDDLTWQAASGDSIRKHVGDVNATIDSVTFGIAQISGYFNGLGAILFAANRTFTSNMTPLIPIYVSVATTFEGLSRQGVVAQVPDVFRINMRDIAPEQEIVVGSDTYVCFPLVNKDSQNTVAGEGYSGWEGLAYKKITDPVV